jgi:hypothetical protein
MIPFTENMYFKRALLGETSRFAYLIGETQSLKIYSIEKTKIENISKFLKINLYSLWMLSTDSRVTAITFKIIKREKN